ncbi:hypothetical protein NEIFLAOT_02295 [Neisseria flavescens NRL30031/H210]|uniref:Uncharacterized protein n=1 Tax=Neisseria flavescens NRL30031/H210 TaxID=546264 RepID=C0EQQ0_NEIFL|nr:hypothetical protein NEIFLAOT_02295 [Neisseria flavescens NRL30031/H210]
MTTEVQTAASRSKKFIIKTSVSEGIPCRLQAHCRFLRCYPVSFSCYLLDCIQKPSFWQKNCCYFALNPCFQTN